MPSAARPTWILLRGLTREAAHWGGFAAAFAQAMPQARVIPLDLPGNGQLHAGRSPANIAAMVACCRAELQRRGESGPIHLLAMSLGAMVAAEWASQAPAEVAGCVLINTSFAPFSPFYHRLRPRNYAPLLRLVLGLASPGEWEQTLLRLTSNCAAAHAAVIPEWTATHLARPVRAGNALRQLLAAARYRAPARPPAVRVLLLASALDGLVDVQCSRTVAARWGVALQLHPSAGHDLPLDDPRWVIGQVQRWLADAPAPPADAAR